MANVVDPNSWRMLPAPHSTQRTADTVDAPQYDSAAAQVSVNAALVSALQASFTDQCDQVLWHLTSDSYPQPRGRGQSMRVDRQHEFAAPSASDHFQQFDSGNATSRPWVVLIEKVQDTDGKRAERIRAALEQDANLLVVVCDLPGPQSGQGENLDRGRQLASRIATRLGCDFVGPLFLSADVSKAFAKIKQAGRPALAYFDARGLAVPAPHVRFAVSTSDLAESVSHSNDLRSVAISALAELSHADPRVVAIALNEEVQLPTAWEQASNNELSAEQRMSLSVRRCLELAHSGSRPFLFLTSEQALDHAGQIRRDICLPDCGITLVVESRTAGNHFNTGSAMIAGLCQLPNASLLSPKDGTELCEMLQWCAVQTNPAVVWLPEECEPPVSWPRGEEIEWGRAERLGQGTDVTLIAWGPLAAAAAIAAENLALRGIGATVVNARFAWPLDSETLSQACQDSAYIVVVDDSPEGGGFAGWVAETLARHSIAVNMTIVTAEPLTDPHDSYDRHQRCAADIVARCAWLAEPVSTTTAMPNMPDVPLVIGEQSVAQSCVSLPNIERMGGADIHLQVLAQQFSPFIEQWVRDYSRVGSRDVYLWRWCLHGLELTTLSCVPPELRQDLRDTKLLAVMYGVMLDDVADQAGNEDFLAALTKIIAGTSDRDFSMFTTSQQEYARFTEELWDAFGRRLQKAPHFARYAELLDYDHRQILNTFAYSCMVNEEPALLNVQEHDMYLPHNMQMMSFSTMDVMHSNSFDFDEIGKLREVVWHAQSMGRIGNLVSTWQREIADRDFTSAVFARALRQGDLTVSDLRHGTPDYIEAAIRRGEHESFFLRKWEVHRQYIQSLAAGIRSVDIGKLLEALGQLLRMELSSRGYK